MVKNLIKFFRSNRDPEKTFSAKITLSKQLVLTKTTYVNFEKKILG